MVSNCIEVLDSVNGVVRRAARRLLTLLWLLVHPATLDHWTALAYRDTLAAAAREAHPATEVVTQHILPPPPVTVEPPPPVDLPPPPISDTALPPPLTDLPANRVECVLVGTDGTIHSVMSMYASARGDSLVKAHGKGPAVHYHVRERHGTRWIYEQQERPQ